MSEKEAVTPRQIINDLGQPLEAPELLRRIEHYWPTIKAALLAYKPKP